ncbi:hypothetical protein BJX68DRAFT_95987 [Aspergillus pseudodeflectus]|uniref:Uncharacterized protein n=1 Tax=Aspergillus pseudodeflectus TaxID=176178 RepID=A0ABR4KBV3_9EURO
MLRCRVSFHPCLRVVSLPRCRLRRSQLTFKLESARLSPEPANWSRPTMLCSVRSTPALRVKANEDPK